MLFRKRETKEQVKMSRAGQSYRKTDCFTKPYSPVSLTKPFNSTDLDSPTTYYSVCAFKSIKHVD